MGSGWNCWELLQLHSNCSPDHHLSVNNDFFCDISVPFLRRKVLVKRSHLTPLSLCSALICFVRSVSDDMTIVSGKFCIFWFSMQVAFPGTYYLQNQQSCSSHNFPWLSCAPHPPPWLSCAPCSSPQHSCYHQTRPRRPFTSKQVSQKWSPQMKLVSFNLLIFRLSLILSDTL